jgi:hypothetical protein
MIKFDFPSGDTTFRPGSQIRLTAVWEFGKQPKSITARLVWVTEGKGTQDSETAIEETWTPESNNGSRRLSWIAPRCPISHSGTVLKIHWQLELESESPEEYAESSVTIRATQLHS